MGRLFAHLCVTLLQHSMTGSNQKQVRNVRAHQTLPLQSLFAPRGDIFYGWAIVGVMGLAAAASMGMCMLNIGLFIKPMGDDLGISRQAFGWAQTARQLGGAVTSPLYGRLVDRYGSRLLLPFAVLLTALGMFYLGRAETQTDLLIAVAVIGLAGYAVPGAILASVPVMKWFEHKRGKAMAVMSASGLIGGMVFLPLSQWLIDSYGWRNAWFILAILGVTLVLPPALFLLRRQPEDFGLLPDGDLSDAQDRARLSRLRQWTPREASRTTSFWLLVAIFSLMALSLSTIGLHRIPAFMDRGLPPMWVAWATALDAVLAGVASVFTGIYAGRIGITRLGALGFVLLAASSVLTILANDIPLMLVSMGLFGAGIGVVMQMQNLIWPEFFGRTHIGAIRGYVMPITLAFSAIGAPFAGHIYDSVGSYNPVWWGAVGLMSLGGIIAVKIKPPTAYS